jgi:hypothetical protein
VSAYLVDVDSSDQYLVTEPSCKVGSAGSSDIVITAPGVLATHIKIDNRSNEYWASLAPGATNTQKFLFVFEVPSAAVNGRKLEGKPIKVADGDKVKVGSRVLSFRIA